MSVKKQYLKNKDVCKVTFRIPAEIGNSSRTAAVVGEFNDWSLAANPMRRLKNGAFTATLDLQKGRSYQFRYLLDKKKWQNEPDADKFVPSPYGDSSNCVVLV